MRRIISGLIFVTIGLSGNAAETAAGRWQGTVQIPAHELSVIIDLAQDRGGAWIGSIIIPGMNIKGAALADIVINDADATFSIKDALGAEPAAAARFKARIDTDGSMHGDFLQGGNSTTFVLKKTGAAQVELPPRSTPVRKEIAGDWVGEYELNGYARHVSLKLHNHAGTAATAEFVIVGKKTNDLPVDLITQEDDFLRIESNATGINFEGRWYKDSGEIRGTYAQGPIELPLILHRTGGKGS
jgi:hypothetical protein